MVWRGGASRRATIAAATILVAVAPAASPAQQRTPEGTTLFGRPLYAAPLTPAARESMERELAAARRAYDRAPRDADSIIWLGRRTAYLGRHREAIAIFGEGIRLHPRDARLFRHRGHRYLSVRRLDEAIADLSRAAELERGRPDAIEPDGQPNARNIPTSTTQSNIWYHLGLAHYLKGDFPSALAAYREGMKVSTNPDMMVAMAYWQYSTLRRMGRDAEAAAVVRPIGRDLELIENGSYLRLLLLAKGGLPVDSLLAPSTGDNPALDDATIGYGVGNWHLYNGRRAEAEAMFRRVLGGASQFAFGYIAAEADLKRLGGQP
jgi:tetratricopeptide (TPR) repeat protein